MRTLQIVIDDDTMRQVRNAYFRAFNDWPSQEQVDSFLQHTAETLLRTTIAESAKQDATQL